MPERASPGAFVGALPDESAHWVTEGLLTEAQRQAILALYPAPAATGRDRTVLIFSILGTVLVGAGMILFFAANWQAIPAAVKLSMILAAVIASYGTGYHFQYTRGDYPRLGHSLIFLGTLFYGGGVWLVAQIFHLDTHYPTGFLLWGLGILPVAAIAASRPVLGFATLLLGIWTVMEQGMFASFNYAFPVLLLAAVAPLARRLKTALVEAGVLGGLYLWFGINIGNALPPRLGLPGSYVAITLFGLMTLYGVALLLLGLGRPGGHDRAYLGVGSLAALTGSYFLTFRWNGALVGQAPFIIAGFVVILAAVAAGGWLYWRRAEAGRPLMLPAVLVPAAAVLFLGVLDPVPRMLLFNMVLFAGTVGLAALGIQRRSSLLVNLGLVLFVIHTITRYFDLFFTAMDRSLFFIVGGILLLGGGWLLERNRRRWLQGGGGGSHAA